MDIPDFFKKEEKFLQFLKDEGCFEEYFQNLKTSGFSDHRGLLLDRSSLISGAFIWGNRNSSWSEIDRKWKEICKTKLEKVLDM